MEVGHRFFLVRTHHKKIELKASSFFKSFEKYLFFSIYNEIMIVQVVKLYCLKNIPKKLRDTTEKDPFITNSISERAITGRTRLTVEK